MVLVVDQPDPERKESHGHKGLMACLTVVPRFAWEIMGWAPLRFIFFSLCCWKSSKKSGYSLSL
jgi:hypothetical protein